MGSNKKEVIEKASKETQTRFDLNKFKTKKGLGAENAKYKSQTWIPLSKGWQEATGLPGIPAGHISLLRGHSDTGKTSTLLECAASCQNLGILPVFIITEVKFDWSFAKTVGVKFEETVDKETGEVTGYDGFFLYADRGNLNTIEDVAAYIMDLLNEQSKGNLPYDLCFLWDSVGSVPCRMSVESKGNNAQWNAGALSQNFGGMIDQLIILSRKQSSPYTNSLVCVNKIWNVVENAFTGQIGIRNKGGEALFYDCSLCVNYGNPGSAGTAKCLVRVGGKELVWGKKTNISIDKCHISSVYHKGKAIMTAEGFILETEAESYKAKHKDEWASQLGCQTENLTFVEVEEAQDSGLYVADS